MPRSSRQKSHRQHNDSDSGEEEISKERKVRDETGVRVSRVSATTGKRKLASQSQKGKDLVAPGNGDLSGEQSGVKRKKVGDEEKGKSLVDSKGKSSRRNDSLSERKEEIVVLISEKEEAKKGTSVKVESKRKSEKDWGRKDAKDKDRDVEEREKKADVVCSEVSRKQGSQKGVFEEVVTAKPDLDSTEWQFQDELRNPELEKELEKRIRRRRDDSDDKDKRHEDDRDCDKGRLSSRDGHIKNGRYKDEKRTDGGRYRDKYRDDLDRDPRYRDEKHRDERSSRNHTHEKSDNKQCRDVNKLSESRHNKTRLQDVDRDGSTCIDERGTRYKDNRGRKRSSDEFEDHNELKSRCTKEHHVDVEGNALSHNNIVLSDQGKSETHYLRSDVADSKLSNNQLKSPSFGALVLKDQYRQSSKQTESTHVNSLSEGRLQPNTLSIRETNNVSKLPESVPDLLPLEKPKQEDDRHLVELSAENASLRYERSPRSDGQADKPSPIQIAWKSPSSTNGGQRNSNRTGTERNPDVEEMRRSSSSMDTKDYSANEDGSQECPCDNPAIAKFSQAEMINRKSVLVGSTSFNRNGRSSSVVPLSAPSRHGIDSHSVLGSAEEGSKGQVGDRKLINRYRRNDDHNMGRGKENAWKGVPHWPSPVTNGYFPFQHGPPPVGFHAMVQQYPGPPLFGVRPSMELNHAGVSYHMHDTERFSSHGHPFGWRNSAEDLCPSRLHGWDGSNGVFGNEAHVYGRPDWDQNRHSMSNREWDMSADVWRVQNGSVNMEFPASQEGPDYLEHVPADETWAEQSSHGSRSERNQPECLLGESIEIKQLDDTPPAKNYAESTQRIVNEKLTEPSKLSSHDSVHFCRVYLSKIDISPDLTHSELYKQSMSLLGMEVEAIGDCNVTKHVFMEDKELSTKSSNHALGNFVFPRTTEEVYQKAISLYKKQNEEMKVKISGSEPEKASTTTDVGEKLEPVEDSSSLEDTLQAKEELAEGQFFLEDTLPAKAEPAEDHSSLGHTLQTTSLPAKDEGGDVTTNSKGELLGNAKEQKSDTCCGTIVFADNSSQGCEALMPGSNVCRLNLSRRLISPESTH